VLARVPLSFARAVEGGLDRVGLGNVKDGRVLANPEAAAFLLLAGVRVGLFLALRGNPRRYLDAMLAAAHLAPERSPGVISEHVLARADIRLGDSLCREACEDRGPVCGRLVADGAV